MSFQTILCRRAWPILAAALAANTALAQSAGDGAAKTFAIHDGDKIVMYGDDVTAQRIYSADLPAFVQCRFPQLNASWVESGWDGDTTTGNPNWWGGGDMQGRTDRDVKAHQPSAVLIELGFNDADKKAYAQERFEKFSRSYQKVLDKIRNDNPGVRLTVVTPVAYDDVNHQPDFDGGVSDVLAKYSAEEMRLAQAAGAVAVDVHSPLTEMLGKAKSIDGARSAKLTDSRWKPDAAAHLLIAAEIAKAWGMDATVSAVALDGGAGTLLSARNAKVMVTSNQGALVWTQTDACLPLPIDSAGTNVGLVLKSSDIIASLDQQIVVVTNLPAGKYSLKIDGTDVGSFTREQLAAGVNLATLKTPMVEQALTVAKLFRAQQEIADEALHGIQIWHTHYEPAINKHMFDCIADLHQAADIAAQEAKKAAQPIAHTYTLTPQ